MKILKNELKGKLKIRTQQDYPVKGVEFVDITPLIMDKKLFHKITKKFCDEVKGQEVDYIVAPEARGFLFGTCVAYELGIPFVPVRKPGKLPREIISEKYDLEYGTNEISIHKDAINPGEKILVVDDLLATGGTVNAVTKLVERSGAEVVGLAFAIELEALKGRELLKKYDVMSLLQY